MLAVYGWGDAIRDLLIVFAWLALVALGIWLLIGLFRDRNVQWWVKALLVLVTVILPPLGFIGVFAFWLDRRFGSPRVVWEGGPRPLGVVHGPAEVHRLDGTVVIVERGQRYEP